MRNFETSIPVGFFTYPISQAADITACSNMVNCGNWRFAVAALPQFFCIMEFIRFWFVSVSIFYNKEYLGV